MAKWPIKYIKIYRNQDIISMLNSAVIVTPINAQIIDNNFIFVILSFKKTDKIAINTTDI